MTRDKVTQSFTKAQLAIAMEDIIRSAKYLRTLPDTRGRPIIWHSYLTEVEVAGIKHNLILAIQEDFNGNLFHDWNYAKIN